MNVNGPFLSEGGYRDEAQCDIHLSPSPLLKHYHSGECAISNQYAALRMDL
jgi:hypothetical protein